MLRKKTFNIFSPGICPTKMLIHVDGIELCMDKLARDKVWKVFLFKVIFRFLPLILMLDNRNIVKDKDMRSKSKDRFKQEDFPDFVPGKFVHGEFYPINVDEHLSLDIFPDKIC